MNEVGKRDVSLARQTIVPSRDHEQRIIEQNFLAEILVIQRLKDAPHDKINLALPKFGIESGACKRLLDLKDELRVPAINIAR